MTVRSGLSEAQRLDLICDAIRYCQRVRDKGMPNSAWTKALRDPIHFLWEKRGGNKLEAARYRSLASAGIPRGGGRIRYDHAVPFRALQAQLMEMADPSTDAVKEVLVRDLTAPFGGVGSSGIGREGGDYALDFYSDLKTLQILEGSCRPGA